jgi:hypothetical protein
MLFPCPVFCAPPPPPVFLRRTPAVASRSARGKYEGTRSVARSIARGFAGSVDRDRAFARANDLFRGRTGRARGAVREGVALAGHRGAD